jgi:hypothetical protein
LNFFQNMFTHAICHLPPKPIRLMFHGIVTNIQLHKYILHCYVFYHRVTMTKQVKY